MYSDIPLGTTILGAAKLNGKLGPSTNVGMLGALTSEETATNQRADLSRFSSVVEPRTFYGVARLLKDFHERKNGLGFLATGTARDLSSPDIKDQLNRGAMTGMIDGWHFIDAKKMWVLSGWAGGSVIPEPSSGPRRPDGQPALLPAARRQELQRRLDRHVAQGRRRPELAQQGKGQLVQQLRHRLPRPRARCGRSRLRDAHRRGQRACGRRLQMDGAHEEREEPQRLAAVFQTQASTATSPVGVRARRSGGTRTTGPRHRGVQPRNYEPQAQPQR